MTTGLSARELFASAGDSCAETAAGARLRFSGERPGRGSGFEYDESRHAVAYRFVRDLARDQRVLDTGRGDGAGTFGLATLPQEVVGWNASADAIAACRARWRVENVRFEQVDIMRGTLSPARFVLALCFLVLEHLHEPRETLHRLQRCLIPGGTLVLTTPNRLRSVERCSFVDGRCRVGSTHGAAGRATPLSRPHDA